MFQKAIASEFLARHVVCEVLGQCYTLRPSLRRNLTAKFIRKRLLRVSCIVLVILMGRNIRFVYAPLRILSFSHVRTVCRPHPIDNFTNALNTCIIYFYHHHRSPHVLCNAAFTLPVCRWQTRCHCAHPLLMCRIPEPVGRITHDQCSGGLVRR